jgi:site-specific DNA-cytosine methylase
MRFLSVCSGIEAASVAWGPLGWRPVAFAEIDTFPAALLAYRYPDVPNLGDMRGINGADFRDKIDVLVGGTPCQSFSVAGLRRGLPATNQEADTGLILNPIRCYKALGNSMAVPVMQWLGERIRKYEE